MNDGVVVGELDGQVLALEELLEMLPVVHLLIQLEAVVVLIHLNVLRVVPMNRQGRIK